MNVSVIIPTHDRRRSLERTLTALSAQTCPAFEIVVVTDGCTDGTADWLRSLGNGVQVVEQPIIGGSTGGSTGGSSGAAAARNAGASRARGDLLLFLDDDMEPGPGLIAAHAEAHRAGRNRVVCGPSLPVLEGRTDFFAAGLRAWWHDLFREMGRPDHRFTCRDALAGNLSVPTALFERIGGFDPSLRCREDLEIGARLLDAGATLAFAPRAVASHFDGTDLDGSFRRAREEGRGDVRIGRRHPHLLPVLQLSRPPIRLGRLAFGSLTPGVLAASLFRRGLDVLEAARLRRWWRGVYGALRDYWYWRGVAEEVETRQGLRDLLGSAGGTEAPDPPPPISVVVCTRDRTALLEGCLRSLLALDYPDYEIVVVDNAPNDDATERLATGFPVRYVREPRPGLDRARNRGIAEARHGLIAFTDDDARPAPGWLTALARAFADPEVVAVTGRVAPAELETPAQRYFELVYGGMGKGERPRLFRRERMRPAEMLGIQAVGVGANMAFRRAALERAGGFDPALDVGTPACGGGDLDMFHRVVAGGGTLRYEPTALVRHQHRREMKGLYRQLRDDGRSYGVYLLKRWREREVPRRSVARFFLLGWAPWLAGRLILGLLGRHRLPLPLLWAGLWGALQAPWAYAATYRNFTAIPECNNPGDPIT